MPAAYDLAALPQAPLTGPNALVAVQLADGAGDCPTHVQVTVEPPAGLRVVDDKPESVPAEQ